MAECWQALILPAKCISARMLVRLGMWCRGLGSETYVLSLLDLGGGRVLAGTDPTGQVYLSTDAGASLECGAEARQ